MRKIEKQVQQTPVHMTVRYLFGGGVAEDVKLFQNTLNQQKTLVFSKRGCVAQITDTDGAFRLKVISSHEHDALRVELHRLAEAEGVRPIYRWDV